MGVRGALGKLRKSAPKISDPKVQRVVDTIYKDLNSVADAVNFPSGTSNVKGIIGKPGDMRLYKGSGMDGSSGYFLQGRFDDGWATVNLTLEEKNPDNSDISTYTMPGQGIEPYITKYGVTFENLSGNADVGTQADQVAVGNHTHEHWTLNNPILLDLSYTGGNITYNDENNHLNVIHFPLSPPNIADSLVDNTNADTGSQNVAARWDHKHKIDPEPDYVWEGANTFGISAGTSGKKLTINGPTSGTDWALDVYGDVRIDGDLVVAYAQLQNNDTELGGNVDLNKGNLNINVIDSMANKTRIYGPTRIDGGVLIDVASHSNFGQDYHYLTDDQNKPGVIIRDTRSVGQLRIEYDSSKYFDFKVDTGGNLNLETIGNINLLPAGKAVLPEGTLQTNLGDLDRQFNSIHAGELVVQNLVAMHVMSTIGGQLLIAPTTKLVQTLSNTETGYMAVEHNDDNLKNAFVILQGIKDDGAPKTEVIKTSAVDDDTNYGTSSNPEYRIQITNRDVNNDGVQNTWNAGEAVVCLYKLGGGGNKGYIELTSTGSTLNSYGPRISLNAAKTTDTAWDAAKKVVVLGNLRNMADYSQNEDVDFGMIIADDATLSTSYLKGATLDNNKGLRLFNTPLNIYNNGNKKVELNVDGTFRLGSALVNTGDTSDTWQTDQSGEGVGLSWDGSNLIISGDINVTGGGLQQELDTLTDSIGDLETDLNNLPNFDALSNYQAAEWISQQIGGNMIVDWNMEFDPDSGSDYDNMQMWKGGDGSNSALFSKANSGDVNPSSGDYTLKGTSVAANSNTNSDAYQTDLTGAETVYPVVPGMKISVSFMGYIKQGQWQLEIKNELGKVGVKIYNADKTRWAWYGIAKTDQTENSWTQFQGTWVIPDTWEFTGQDPLPDSTEPIGWVVPWIFVDEHSSQESPGVEHVYFDQVQMYIDSSLALPAAPPAGAGFYAGSDIFGIHDGSNWRTYFGLNAGNSVFQLKDSSGANQLNWNGTSLMFGSLEQGQPTVVISGETGDISMQGSLRIGNDAHIMNTGGGYDTNASFFLGTINQAQKFSIVADYGVTIPGTATQPKLLFDSSTGQLQFKGLIDQSYFKELVNGGYSYGPKIRSLKPNIETGVYFYVPLSVSRSCEWWDIHDELSDDPQTNHENGLSYTLSNVAYFNVTKVSMFLHSEPYRNEGVHVYVQRRYWNGADWTSWQIFDSITFDAGNGVTSTDNPWDHNHKTNYDSFPPIIRTSSTSYPLHYGQYKGKVQYTVTTTDHSNDTYGVNLIFDVDNTRGST